MAGHDTAVILGANGHIFAGMKCHNYGWMAGHILPFFPNTTTNHMYAYNFSSWHTLFMIDKWWILLEMCSTCCVTKNIELLESLHPCSTHDSLQMITDVTIKEDKWHYYLSNYIVITLYCNNHFLSHSVFASWGLSMSMIGRNSCTESSRHGVNWRSSLKCNG